MPNSSVKKTKKERITFYAPPKIFAILNEILTSGRYTNQGEAICAAIMEFGKELQNNELSEKTDERFNDVAMEIKNMQAIIDVLTDRLSTVEQKYSLITRVVAEQEAEYQRKPIQKK